MKESDNNNNTFSGLDKKLIIIFIIKFPTYIIANYFSGLCCGYPFTPRLEIQQLLHMEPKTTKKSGSATSVSDQESGAFWIRIRNPDKDPVA